MPGTKSGGEAAAKTNKIKQGDDWFERIGAIGGKLGTTGGFYGNPEAARVAGRVGGKLSRRSPRIGSTSRLKVTADTVCTFCSGRGHSAHTCVIRANTIKHKKVVAARKRVQEEQHQLDREKLSRLASKYGIKRPW